MMPLSVKMLFAMTLISPCKSDDGSCLCFYCSMDVRQTCNFCKFGYSSSVEFSLDAFFHSLGMSFVFIFGGCAGDLLGTRL